MHHSVVFFIRNIRQVDIQEIRFIFRQYSVISFSKNADDGYMVDLQY